MKKFFRGVGLFFWDILQMAVLAATIFIISYLFFFQPHQVIGNSMEPNFEDREYLLTDKISYRFRKPQRGDVVIFKSPPDPEKDYIKRIIGLPGEKIKIQGGKVFINGGFLNESYLSKEAIISPGVFLREGQEVKIPDDSYIVLGDNRSNSFDSRSWGPVPTKDIIGRAFLRYWPFEKLNLLKEATYVF